MSARLDSRGQWTDIVIPGRYIGDEYRFLIGLTEHDLKDLEFALAQRTAMARRCPEEDGEHGCANAPGHDGKHLCRACRHEWEIREQENGT